MHVMQLIFLITIGVINSSNAQTFQYSRGWTNGKRASMDDVAYLTIPKPNERLSHSNNVKLPCDPHCGTVIILTKNKLNENYIDEFSGEDNIEPIMNTRYKRSYTKV